MTIGLVLDLVALVAFGAAALYSDGWYRLVAVGLAAFMLDQIRIELGDAHLGPPPAPLT